MRTRSRRRVGVHVRRLGAVVGQRGSAIPFVTACLGLVLLVGAALGVAGAMVADHRRAQAAADLAALAAAGAVQVGGDGCATGARIAAANGARLTGCDVAGPDVTVVVRVGGPRWLGATGDLEAQSEAGPG